MINYQFFSFDCEGQIAYQIFFQRQKRQVLSSETFFQHQETPCPEVLSELIYYELPPLHTNCEKYMAQKYNALGKIKKRC